MEVVKETCSLQPQHWSAIIDAISLAPPLRSCHLGTKQKSITKKLAVFVEASNVGKTITLSRDCGSNP